MQHLTLDNRSATLIKEEEEPHFDTSVYRNPTPVLEVDSYEDLYT